MQVQNRALLNNEQEQIFESNRDPVCAVVEASFLEFLDK